MVQTSDLAPELLASLVDASAAINSGRTLDETLEAIARAAVSVLRAEASSVIMIDAPRGRQVFRAAVGDCADQLLGVEYEQGAGISGKVLRTGEADIVNDVARDSAHHKDIDSLVGFRTESLIAAPLIHHGDALGVVEVLNPVDGGRFGEPDRQLAEIFANLAAIAVANSQLCERLRKDNRGLKTAVRGPGEMIGDSEAMGRVKDLIARVARSSATVLLQGETGTGKELAARLVHTNSTRAERPFIAVNCAALPHTLLESELFGHEAGAFTGASARKLGRFELADGGTIFLDEVAEIDPDVQVKLLRVLQEREIVRVGGVAPIGCDVRVIAATNRNLPEEMAAGRFRKDLFFRLNVFPVEMPPLRDRKEDVPLLADSILTRIAGELNVCKPKVSPAAAAALAQYDYPGNVRELQNVLERACLLSGEDGEIGPEHLPQEITGAAVREAAGESGGSLLAAGERAMILNALRESGWNQSKAARALGVSRDNIRYRMKKYDIRKPES